MVTVATSGLTRWRRIVVVDAGVRREVLLSATAAMRDSLRNEGVELDSRRVLVVTADGAEVDIDAAPTVLDGALVTIVDLSAVDRAPRVSVPSGEVRSRAVDGATAVWLAVAAAALLAALASALGALPAHDGGTIAVRYVAVALFAVLAVASVVVTVPTSASFSFGLFIVPGALAFAAGFLAVPVQLAASAHLAGFVALLAAAIAQTAVHARVAALPLGGATALVALSLVVLSAVWGITLLLGLDVAVAAALATGFAPVALRVLPLLVLDVPDGQLLEYSSFKQNRWTVRETTPPPSHPVTAVEMRATMTRARLEFRAGTVLFSLVPALTLPFLLLTGTTDSVARIATLVLVAAIVVSLSLSPRSANSPVQRWAPRIGAALVALEFALAEALRQPATVTLLAGVAVLVIALAIAAMSIPIARGSRSIGVSRFADIAEALATVVAFPAAFAAAGLIDILRGTVS
jgi:hypothetical protein